MSSFPEEEFQQERPEGTPPLLEEPDLPEEPEDFDRKPVEGFSDHPVVKAVRNNPWKVAGLVVVLGFLLVVNPPLVWTLLVLVAFVWAILEADYKAAMGSLLVGALAPALLVVAGILSAIAPVILLGGLFWLYAGCAGSPPKPHLSDETKHKLSYLRRSGVR